MDEKDSKLIHFLRNLSVKEYGAYVILYNGFPKVRQDLHAAVINLGIGEKNTFERSDAVIRLHSEFLFRQKQFKDISFYIKNKGVVEFVKYAEGFRPKLEGDKILWQKRAVANYSRDTLKEYLDFVFPHTGAVSILNELEMVRGYKTIRPGDVFNNINPDDHTVLVLDVAINPKTNHKIFLLAQSFSPAEEIHVLKNLNDKTISPWFSTENKMGVETEEWSFFFSSLYRFPYDKYFFYPG